MKIYDITVLISAQTPIYKGDPGVEIKPFKSIAAGASANVSQVSFGVHTGTHVDAPNHFIEGGRRVHELDPRKLVGPCRVVEVPADVVAIEPQHVGDISGVERVIFKTRNSQFWSEPELGFRTDFTYLVPETAKLLVENGVVLVGIDYLSIEKSGSPGHPVHVTFLEKEVIILEGVDLREVPADDYELMCLPFKYDGATGDGSPARTFLREMQSMNKVNDKTYRERVYQIVSQIPVGKVMTYGQLANILGEDYTARRIGYVMGGSDEGVPWQRVINSQGKCSTGRLTIPLNLQQELLETEGVVFSSTGKCDLGKFQWFPEGFKSEEDEQIRLFGN